MGEGLLCIHTLPSSFTCTIHNQQKKESDPAAQ